MTTDFREEWRRWNEAQITEVSWQVCRMVIRITHVIGMYRDEFGRNATEADLEHRRLYNYARYEELWPEHQFGLSIDDCIRLADITERLVLEKTACRKIAEDWLWNTMQAEVCTDKIELPTDFLASQ